VFDDADLDAAVDGAMASKYRNMGQTCVCANRIYAQDGVYDAFVEKLTAAVAALEVGDGTEAGVTQGPLINAAGAEKVRAHLADALGKGGKVIASGTGLDGGNFVRPVVVAEANPEMRLAQEETFGPLAPLFRFETEAEAVRLANESHLGLNAYVFSADLDHGRRLAERWCAECHAVADKPTRFRRSLPFAAIAAKDGVTLETLTAFLLLPHATMSNAPLSRQDAADLAAYIMALKK
jgi:succinate-semialdehyde dehydrogenase/glutarate-semialdehyde dehydrogenase